MRFNDREFKIASLTFEEFWTYLRKEAGRINIDIAFKSGQLEMQWLFHDQETKLKIIKLLKQRGAKYRVNHLTVCFWVGIDRDGRPYLVEA